MQTEAVFEDIENRIQREIKLAEKSILILVDQIQKDLLKILVDKAKESCQIYLIQKDGKAVENSEKIKVIHLDNFGEEETLKNFCIIDFKTVISGSFNRGNKDSFKNIIITKDDTSLTQQFIAEFNRILKQYFPDEPLIRLEFDLNKIIKRLEILKNYILLEDIDELNKETEKIHGLDFNEDIHEIIEDVKNEEFASAISRIQNFINRNQQLSIWTDPEIAALKLEIKNLENQLNALQNEKAELEKVLAEFQHHHTIELGEIILEILRLRKIKFKENETKYEEAVEDEKQYQEQVNEEREKEIFELSAEEKAELKRKYRKATMLCHPDKFVNEPKEIQKQAEDIFKELNEANAKNDLARVAEILEYLEKGVLTTSKGDELFDKEKLRKTIDGLREKVKKVEVEIIAIVESDTYNTIINIDNWEDYFKRTKKKLQMELEELKMKVKTK